MARSRTTARSGSRAAPMDSASDAPTGIRSAEVSGTDLARSDPTERGPAGGPRTKDNASVEYYCTIFAMAESKKQRGLLWVGSDDGLVHVSKDGGRNWQNVTPPALPPGSMIS